MDFQPEFEIGIVEYRNIIKAIKDKYDYDFNDYALTSLKRRFERVIMLHNLRHPDNLVERIREDAVFFDKVLQEISVETTEMFRDPSFWRYLRDELLPVMLREQYKMRVWFPLCVSGDELFTFAIILREMGCEDKVEIIASCINDLVIQNIKKGVLRSYKVEVSNDNYGRYQGSSKLSDYYKMVGEQALRDTSLIKNVNFIKQNINFDNSQHDIKLVFFRNQLIYFNQNQQDKALKVVYDSLIAGGHLVIGYKEQLGMMSSACFKVVNAAENVYKKI